jgi:hypothetical protein
MITVKIQNLIVNSTKVIFSIAKILVLTKKPSNYIIERKSDSVIILANGPSFSKTYEDHKDFLKDKETLCVNYFPVSPLFEEIKPRFSIISGPDVWQENISDEVTQRFTVLFEALAQKTTWEMTFFIPCEARNWKKWQNILSTNKNISIYYYNNTPIEGWQWFQHLTFNLKMGMPRPQNIIIPSIYNLIQLKYKTIYLWGVDHSWLKEITVTDDNVPLICQKHFYDEGQSKPLPMHKGGKGQRKLHEILYKFMTTFESYFILKDYAHSKGTTIINNTPDSLIDAFDKQKLA